MCIRDRFKTDQPNHITSLTLYMKALQTEISNLLHSYIAVVERNEPYFKSPFHYHPELELVYVKESHGKRIIGDKLDTFTDGDMVFMGSNLPHIWLNDEIY